MRNSHLQYRCQWTYIKVENTDSPFTNQTKRGQVLHTPISHGEGNYYVDEATLARMEERGQVVFRYCMPDGEVTPEANPNGSLCNIAGVCNVEGNVLGMMPHPERCCEEILGGTDGLYILGSLLSV
jgi:phosphoribosylformylglycinamidine synthase